MIKISLSKGVAEIVSDGQIIALPNILCPSNKENPVTSLFENLVANLISAKYNPLPLSITTSIFSWLIALVK
jgi:hypothetical protein